jgi:signal transduction histidine kinase
VAVFDRCFKVHPYGTKGDDWLGLLADQARNAREPSSSIAKKFFIMDEATRKSTELNYMLRLPYPEQLVGVVEVQGQRGTQAIGATGVQGLIPAADREGFLHNAAFRQLRDLARGAVEAIAAADRELQIEEKRRTQEKLLASLRNETRLAIQEIESSSQISRSVKLSLIRGLTNTQQIAERHTEISQERESTLEIMSLLGVVAGFMTHEFGAALDHLEKAHERLERIAMRDPSFNDDKVFLAQRIARLKEFVTYSEGYIRGAAQLPNKPFLVRPRLLQVVKYFGKYATDRNIDISVEVESDLTAPAVPVSLYNGIALNLYTNALKAVTAKSGSAHKEIAFRAWNEDSTHFLQVSDTGVGIPNALKARVFDPLFTTTSSNKGPLGSGMGLGLALVQRCVKAFSGRVEVVEPPPNFSTCFQVKLPISE